MDETPQERDRRLKKAKAKQMAETIEEKKARLEQQKQKCSCQTVQDYEPNKARNQQCMVKTRTTRPQAESQKEKARNQQCMVETCNALHPNGFIDYEQNIQQVLELYYVNSGARRFEGADHLDDSDAVQKLKDEIDNEPPTIEETTKMMETFLSMQGHFLELFSCGTCGIRDTLHGQYSKVSWGTKHRRTPHNGAAKECNAILNAWWAAEMRRRRPSCTTK